MGRPKKEKKLTQEQIDRQDLIDYLSTIWTGEINYAMVGNQLKTIMKDNPEFTYKGIKYTLWFAINHEGMQITSLGIVPYIYNQARDYCIWLNKIKKQVKAWEIKDKDVAVIRSKDREENIFE